MYLTAFGTSSDCTSATAANNQHLEYFQRYTPFAVHREKILKRDTSNVGAKALLSLHPDKTQPAYVEELELSDRDFATAVINSKW